MTNSHDNRRSALAKIVTLGLGTITAALAGLVALVASPASRASGKRWRPALSMFDLPPDAPTAAVLAERRADGWYQSRREAVVYIDREGDGYRGFLATCTHLGCRVRWDAETSHFRCPCHGGVFNRDGEVVSGPPPGPLTRVAVRVNPQTSNIEVEL